MPKNGGTAFPVNYWVGGPNGPQPSDCSEGMTLRDYFAANAVAGGFWPPNANDHDQLAEWAYKVADAMLAEREK